MILSKEMNEKIEVKLKLNLDKKKKIKGFKCS